jgi:four helix bundle protein
MMSQISCSRICLIELKDEGGRMKDEGKAPEDLRSRTKRYGLSVISLFTRLPSSRPAQVIGGQFLRSGSSVGAHYREASRSRSDAEFISKIETALQELDETAYWLEVLTESQIYVQSDAFDLLGETDELISIFVTIIRRRKNNR